MNSNQEILDATLTHRILLLGFSKQLAEEVISYLKQTEPEIRALLLKQFSEGGLRLITRLRETEARLLAIRGEAWKKAHRHAALRLQEMAEREPDAQERILGEAVAPLVKKDRTALVVGTLIAGRTLSEWFDSMEAGDMGRSIAQLRISAMAGESVTKMSRRLTGKLSMISPSAYNGIRSVSATAVGNVSDRIRYAATQGMYDLEVWVSRLDSRTTESCFSLNHQIFAVGEGIQPGYHLHCRSVRVPYLGGGRPSSQAFEGFSFSDLSPIDLEQVYG